MQMIFRFMQKHALKGRFVVGFLIVAVLSVLFIELADDVRTQETLPFDRQALLTINSYSYPLLDTTIPLLTDLGGVIGVTVLTLTVCVALLLRKQSWRALFIAMSVAGAALINLLLKALFERQRPSLWEQLIVEYGYSFPSGHAMASAALGLAIAAAFWRSRWRWWAVVAAGCYIIFIGFTRLYLGVHYPSDIVAGWMVSGVWVMMVAWILNTRLARRRVTSTP